MASNTLYGYVVEKLAFWIHEASLLSMRRDITNQKMQKKTLLCMICNFNIWQTACYILCHILLAEWHYKKPTSWEDYYCSIDFGGEAQMGWPNMVAAKKHTLHHYLKKMYTISLQSFMCSICLNNIIVKRTIKVYYDVFFCFEK